MAFVAATLLISSCASESTTAEPSPTGSTKATTSTASATTVPATTTAPATTAPATTAPATTAPSTTTIPVTTSSVLGPSLARELADLDRMMRSPAAPEAERRSAGIRLQLIYRQLSRDEALAASVLGVLDADVLPFVQNNLAAAKAPSDPTLARIVPPSPTVPAWTIRPPKPVTELLGYYREAEALTGIEWTYIAAINLVETRFGRIVGPSSANALGPMQFLPTTWEGFCEGDIWNDRDAIICAGRYLRQRGGPANMSRALQGYNPNDAYELMVTSYAANLRADPEALVGYHSWQIFVGTTAGPIRLPEGYSTETPIDATTYLAAHPEDRA